MESANQLRKNQREWNIIRLFRESYLSFPVGEIEKNECPDFILFSRNHTIGIELTELKYERQDLTFNMRAHESLLEEIMEGAQKIVESKTDQQLVVDVHFYEGLVDYIYEKKGDNKSDLIKKGLMDAIAQIVLDNIPDTTGKMYCIDRHSKYGDLNLPSNIEIIYITNATGRFKEGLWYAGISTRIKPMCIESIVQRLSDKEKKLKHYNPLCTKFWLIIIQNSFIMSSSYNPQNLYKTLHHSYISSFDRVFIFERSKGTVTELKIIHP